MPAKRSSKPAKPMTSRSASLRTRSSTRRLAPSTVGPQGALRVPTNLKDLLQVVALGEGPTLEFKRSTGELKEGLQTICAFLSGPEA